MNTGTFSISSQRIVTDGGIGPGTIIVQNGRIAEVRPGSDLANSKASTNHVDVGDLVVMPGVIDAHVHVNEPGRTDWEGFATAGRAAAAGGVTTIVVMPLNCSPVATTLDSLQGEAAAAAGKCAVDYGFWGGVIPGNSHELRALWDAGVLGFKCFMVHSGIDEFPNVTSADLDQAMPILAGLTKGGAVLLAHAEDPGEIDKARASSGLDRKPRSYAAYLASRPSSAEERAIETMIAMCRKHNSRVHIVHVSAAGALDALTKARHEGLPISTETCPHYLALSAEQIADGQTIFKCAPPIREKANQEQLWTALHEGALDLIASDHSPCPPELKLLDEGDFAKAWGGISSLQLTLPLVWAHAHKRGFTLSDIVKWLCTAPARLAGVDAFKGRIAPGYDADLTIWNPDAEWVIHAGELQHRHKVTPYDGTAVRGVVKATFVRGQLAYGAHEFAPRGNLDKDGFASEAGGQWVKRTRT